MQVQIFKIGDLTSNKDELLETIQVNTSSLQEVQNQVGSALIRNAKAQWGDDIRAKTDSSIFGGYIANSNGDCIVAR